MRNAIALIAVLALAACSKKKNDAPKDEPAGVTKPETGSGSAPAMGSGSAPAMGSGSAPAMGSGSAPAMGSGSAATPAAPAAPPLEAGFSWTPPEAAFTAGNDASNPVAWGDDAEVGLAFGKVDKQKLPVQIVVVTGGKAEAKKTLSIDAPGEVGSFTLAPAGKGKFYVELDLSWSDAAGTHDLLGAVLSKTDKGITVDQSGNWQEVGDDKKKTPKWAADARTHIGEE